MKKTLLMSSLMVALAAAGLNADTHDTEMDTEGEFETEMDTQDGVETDDEFDTEVDTQDEFDTDMDAQDENGMGEVDHAQLFMELDTNADGVISRDEAEAATDYPSLAEQFDELDQDGNDELSMEEFEEWEPEEGEGMEW